MSYVSAILRPWCPAERGSILADSCVDIEGRSRHAIILSTDNEGRSSSLLSLSAPTSKTNITASIEERVHLLEVPCCGHDPPRPGRGCICYLASEILHRSKSLNVFKRQPYVPRRNWLRLRSDPIEAGKGGGRSSPKQEGIRRESYTDNRLSGINHRRTSSEIHEWLRLPCLQTLQVDQELKRELEVKLALSSLVCAVSDKASTERLEQTSSEVMLLEKTRKAGATQNEASLKAELQKTNATVAKMQAEINAAQRWQMSMEDLEAKLMARIEELKAMAEVRQQALVKPGRLAETGTSTKYIRSFLHPRASSWLCFPAYYLCRWRQSKVHGCTALDSSLIFLAYIVSQYNLRSFSGPCRSPVGMPWR